jgi:hypothetical protein
MLRARRRRTGALLVAAAIALTVAALPARAVLPTSYAEATPPASTVMLCPADLDSGGGLVWLRFGAPAGGHDPEPDVAAAGVDPPTPLATIPSSAGCPSAASAASGASLIAFNQASISSDDGRVFAADRAPGGALGPAVALSAGDEAVDATTALASTGAAIVAWKQPIGAGTSEAVVVQARARDGAGAFMPAASLDVRPRTRAEHVRAGVDDFGFGLVAWASARGDGAQDVSILVATRGPGGGFAPAREIGRTGGVQSLALSVSPNGLALLAITDAAGVQVATGTARDGVGTLRRRRSAPSADVATALSATGAAAVAWRTHTELDQAARDGVLVSDRSAGGEFGAAHALVTRTSRLGGSDASSLRLAVAPDGRVLATWAVPVNAGDGAVSAIPVAALRRLDGGWDPLAAIGGTCRRSVDAFPGFDPLGRPRVTTVNSGLISGGDYGFPWDTRVRVVTFGAAAPAAGPRPQPTIIARRQTLMKDEVRLRVRCAAACDAYVFAVIRGRSEGGSGLFPQWRRLRAGRAETVTLAHENYFDETNGVLDRSARTRTVRVRLVVHACDSAGQIARARRTISVRVPRDRLLR